MDDRAGPFLRDLACARPQLDVRILIWKSALPVAASQHFFPHRAKACFRKTPVHFRLDESVPMGACHHQKVLVIDDMLAFCGGGRHVHRPMGHHRTQGRRPASPHAVRRRARPAPRGHDDGGGRGCRHDGRPVPPPLEALARDRHRASRRNRGAGAHALAGPCRTAVPRRTRRPRPHRTRPGATQPEVRENEALHLAAVKAAKRSIYMENQYARLTRDGRGAGRAAGGAGTGRRW